MSKRNTGIRQLTVSLLAVGGFFAMTAHAAVAPQDIGFPDVEFSTLSRPNCEVCHGKAPADRHHNTAPAKAGDCGKCHSVSTSPGKVGVGLERNCTSCHKTSPHHETQAAKDKKCNACHSTPGLSAYSTVAPTYKPSSITPKRAACRNCHAEGTANGLKIGSPQKTHHTVAAAGCDTCHGTDKASQDVRACERCHSVEAIHQVVPHVAKTACSGCHAVGG